MALPRSQTVLYPNVYVWFIFVSAMDVMMTWVVLAVGGHEANGLADAVIRRFGLPGMAAYKFTLAALVVTICETVGRRKPDTGRRLAEWAVAISCVPVVLAFIQLLTALLSR